MAYLKSITGREVYEYLYSTVGAAFASATLADGAVDADSEGNRVLEKGTVLAKITTPGVDSGKVGPYDTGASDGRQTATNIIGILDTGNADVTNGDMEVSYLYAGTVDEDKVFADGTRGSLSGTVKTNLQTTAIDILFR